MYLCFTIIWGSLLTYRRLGSGAVGRFGTGILVTIWVTAPATPAKLKIGWDLEAGSTKNEMPPLEFELGEKSQSSTCKLTRKSWHWHASNHVFCDGRVSQTMCFAMVESVKLLSLWRFGRRIRVTQASWAFFFSRKSQFSNRLQMVKN